jgi:outer membrane protein assembly factor BamB
MGGALGSSIPATISAQAVVVTPDTTPGGWPKYTHDAQGTGSASAESIISTSTASTMGLKWSFQAADKIYSQPTIAKGMVFFSDNSGLEHGLDLNGKEVWKTDLGQTTAANGGYYTQGPVSSAQFAAVTGGTVGGATHVLYVGGGYGQLFALNADIGAVIWQNQITDPKAGGFAWTSPLLANNAVYMGVSSEADHPSSQASSSRSTPSRVTPSPPPPSLPLGASAAESGDRPPWIP